MVKSFDFSNFDFNISRNTSSYPKEISFVFKIPNANSRLELNLEHGQES